MSEPSKLIGVCANIHTRMLHFAKVGDKIVGHKHTFDHLTLLASGSLRVVVDEKESEFKAPHLIWIDKDKVHELTALEDNTVAACINGIRDGENVADLIDPSMIPIGEKVLPSNAKPIAILKG
jgi:quercetin dioxygenase-like cupin family protein